MTDVAEKIQVTITGFGGSQTLDLDKGDTLEVAANGAGLSPEAVIRLKGQRVEPSERDQVEVEDGDVIAATAPAPKQG